MDDIRMEEDDIKRYISIFTYVILDNVAIAVSLIARRNCSRDLNKNDLFVLMEEFLFFNMNVCGRFTYHWFGAKVGETIVDKIFSEIGSSIDQNREKILDKKLDSLTLQSFSDYLDTLRHIQNSDNLRNLYNRREEECYEYDLIREDQSKGKKGLLAWEFSEKLTVLLYPDNNPGFVITVYMIAVELSTRIISTRKIWEKKSKNDLAE
jgi:hypothetical protein